MPALRGLSIAVLEPQPPPRLEAVAKLETPDLRTFAITPSSRRILQGASGAWDLMEAVRAPAFTSMQVWDSLGPGFVRFEAPAGAAAVPNNSPGGDDPSPLGYILENRLLQSALFERLLALHERGSLTLISPAAVTKLVLPPSPGAAEPGGPVPGPLSPRPGELATLTLADGSALRARLVVGADGAGSRVRDWARIGTWGWDYDQRAVVATVRAAGSGALRTAWQRFLPHGPVAILPLSGDYASVVWSTTPSHAEYLTSPSLSPEDFTHALNAVLTAAPETFAAALRGGDGGDSGGAGAHAGSPVPDAADYGSAAWTGGSYERGRDALPLDPVSLLLGAGRRAVDALSTASFQADRFRRAPLITSTVGARASFPLRFSKANAYVRPRLALVGDAAHVVHPLAGQGLNLGIADADALARALAAGAEQGADPGSLSLLREYEKDRSAHNLLMMGALDAVKRVFSGPGGVGGGAAEELASAVREPLAVARNLGMLALNAAGPLKERVAAYAMGGR
jgi:ubiquinone biosynthesis monooxygenase Coq6